MLRTSALLHARLGSQALPDVVLAQGEDLLVLGPSGSGKTSLLGLIAGWLTPQSGAVELGGVSIFTLPRAHREAWCSSRIGVIPHQANLLAPLTVRENLELVQRFAQRAGLAAARAGLPVKTSVGASLAVAPLLEQLDIAALADRPAHALSQGQQQRVAIARALIHRPDLILADEPTAHLDDMNCARTLDALQQAAQSHHAALIVVTHDQRVKQRFTRQMQLGAPA